MLFTYVHTYIPLLRSVPAQVFLFFVRGIWFFWGGGGVGGLFGRSVVGTHACTVQVTFWIIQFVNLLINNIYMYSVCTCTYIYTTTYICKCNAIGLRIHTYSNSMYVHSTFIVHVHTYENEHDDGDISHRV